MSTVGSSLQCVLAPETLDIALATRGGAIDIVAPELDGTPIETDAEAHLDFQRTLAFENFKLYTNPYRYEFSDIDNPNPDRDAQSGVEDFKLFEFAAKHDPIPTMLTQNHVSVVPGYLGQTTSFNMDRDSRLCYDSRRGGRHKLRKIYPR